MKAMLVHALTCVTADIVAGVARDAAAAPQMNLHLMDSWDPILLWTSSVFHSP
jgi:hypothetical protein